MRHQDGEHRQVLLQHGLSNVDQRKHDESHEDDIVVVHFDRIREHRQGDLREQPLRDGVTGVSKITELSQHRAPSERAARYKHD